MPSRKKRANALRVLAIDAIEHAKSGHPGAPMGMADMAEALWLGALKHNPNNPHWVNRDRFILSNGHASMLLYGLLHLSGYNITIDDIKIFRQLNSKTPGHPEFGQTPGVEVTTGPLGQGFATAVGMALAERLLSATFNREHFPIIDHYTYVFVGDGCLMEGISHEACSLAGALKLGKLIVFYDDNGISIDGKVDNWFMDNTVGRFEACGWHVISHIDGHDGDSINKAILTAQNISDKPTLICCKTIIGYGSPNKSNSASCHGSPLGPTESALTRSALGFTTNIFEIPKDIQTDWDCKEKGAHLEKEWNELFTVYAHTYPDLATEFKRRIHNSLPDCLNTICTQYIQKINTEQPQLATRVASKETINVLSTYLPELFGGSADLSESVGTLYEHAIPIHSKNWKGNYLSYGVREFLMGAMMNGLSLHGGFIPYGGTFLVFSDYARNAIRLSALMKQHVIWVLSHDSIALGEDGPTHQPVEHIESLRLIPNLMVWRPCDAVETATAWKSAITTNMPSCIILTRQPVPCQPRTPTQIDQIEQGGYIIYDSESEPDIILIATGSEVDLAIRSAKKLHNYNIRVVSLPCTLLFDKQPDTYKENILPNNITKRIAIEAGSTNGWWKYVGLDGIVIGMNNFGESAPGDVLLQHFGFTEDHLIKTIKDLLD